MGRGFDCLLPATERYGQAEMLVESKKETSAFLVIVTSVFLFFCLFLTLIKIIILSKSCYTILNNFNFFLIFKIFLAFGRFLKVFSKILKTVLF